MELVEATTEDLDTLTERWYALASAMEAYDELNELSYTDAADVPRDGFRALLDQEAVSIYLVVHDGTDVGYVTLREGHRPSRKHAEYLRIVDLVIDEAHRDQGLGSEVIDRVKAIAKEQGCDHLTVACEWENDGPRRFYRTTGFRPKQVEYACPLR